jgi:hypothetical protein
MPCLPWACCNNRPKHQTASTQLLQQHPRRALKWAPAPCTCRDMQDSSLVNLSHNIRQVSCVIHYIVSFTTFKSHHNEHCALCLHGMHGTYCQAGTSKGCDVTSSPPSHPHLQGLLLPTSKHSIFDSRCCDYARSYQGSAITLRSLVRHCSVSDAADAFTFDTKGLGGMQDLELSLFAKAFNL